MSAIAENASSNTLVQNVHDIIAEFHKILVLKAMTQYVEEDFHKAVTLRPRQNLADNNLKHWHKYLDKLSYVCDFKHGGETVTGVLAQAADQNAIFWLATNCSYHRYRTAMLAHLQFVLDELNKPHGSVRELADVIRRRSIDFSRDKVDQYRSRLKRELRRLTDEKNLKAGSREYLVYEATAEFLQRARHDRQQLCSAARELVCGKTYSMLTELVGQTGSRFYNVKHYIDRLCSWHKAARYLARCANMFRQYTNGAELRILPADIFHTPEKIMLSSNADDLLLWILGQQRQHYLPILRGKLSFAKGFLKTQGGKTHDTVIHAEAALAQFAWINKIEFLSGDRYIGCSKPSCYACSIYLSKHPGNFVQRPGHGNAWFRWYPPRMIEQPDDKMTCNLLRTITADMQADLDDTMDGDELGKRRPFESTSGIETTSRRLHEALTLIEEHDTVG